MSLALHRPAALAAVVCLLAGATAACTGRIQAPPGAATTTSGGAAGATTGAAGTTSFSSGVTCNGTTDAPVVPLRRLTQQEYASSVRDLLGMTTPVSTADIPADENVGPFASNSVTALTDLGTQQYLDSAEMLSTAAVATVESRSFEPLATPPRPA